MYWCVIRNVPPESLGAVRACLRRGRMSTRARGRGRRTGHNVPLNHMLDLPPALAERFSVYADKPSPLDRRVYMDYIGIDNGRVRVKVGTR